MLLRTPVRNLKEMKEIIILLMLDRSRNIENMLMD